MINLNNIPSIEFSYFSNRSRMKEPDTGTKFAPLNMIYSGGCENLRLKMMKTFVLFHKNPFFCLF